MLRIALTTGLVSALVTPAIPYEIPTSPSGSWTGSGITTGTFTFGGASLGAETGSYFKTTPSGLRLTITVDGTFPPGSGSYFFTTPPNTNTGGLNPTAAGTSPGPFTTTPVMPIGANPIWLLESVFTCKTNFPSATTCPGIGNVTVTFTDPLGGLVPVVQPKIHVTRLGGTVGAMELGAGLQNNTSGIIATAAATATLAVKGGNEVYGNPTPVGNTLNVECGVSATTTAGCGTVQVTGTNSSLNFTVNAYRTTAGANAWGDGADGFFFDMSFDEDFGSLPSTYEGGGIAAANLLTDLRLGATVSAENTLTAADANGGATGTGMLTVSPLAAAAGAIPGDTNDGVTFPLLTTSMVSSTYTVTPTISGASRAGVVCGWIDFDANGTFTPATEGVCAPFAAGATSVPLNFTVPASGISAGPTYARVRTTYDTNMTTSSFNGLFSSGETEDYQIHIKPLVKVVKAIAPASDTGTFNLLINGTSFASAVGNAGTTGFKTVYHTDTPDVTVATNIQNASIAGVALTETAAGASVLTDYATTSACVDANNTAVVTGGTAAAPTVTIPQSAAGNAKAQTITCTLTNTRLPKVRVQKSTVGGFGGPFNFAQTNLASAPTAIITVAAATPTPAAPAAINATTIGTAVTITETPAAGYALTSASCTDANSAVTGNSGAIGSFAGNVLTIPAANVKAAADFTCLFTNTRATIKVQKTTVGGFGGPFSFAQTNLLTTPAAITTAAVATATPAAPTAHAVTTIGTAVTLTETPLAGYAITAAACTDANSAITGNIGSFGTLAGNVLTVASANVKAGADLTCGFTNTKLPTVQISKTSLGGVGGFTFTGTNGWTSQMITTVTSGTAVTGAVQTLTAASTATTLTEAIPAGYAMTAASCSGLGAGTATPNLAAGTIALDAAATAAGNVVTCAVTNSKLPSLTLVKTITNDNGGAATLATFPLTATGPTTITGVSGTAAVTSQLVAIGTYALSETTSTTYTAGPWSCTVGTLTGSSLVLAAGQVSTCTINNNDIAPVLTLVKTVTNDNGGASAVAAFTFTATGPTTITGVTGAAAVTAAPVSVGTYALSETGPAGYVAGAWSCTAGTLTGSNLVLALGQTATCTINNNDVAPTLTLRKTTTGGVNTFSFTGTNGFGSDSITTLVAGTPVSGATKTLTLGNTATDITETVTSGYFLNGAPTCTGMGSGGAVTLVSGSTYRLNAAATANASNIICTFANTLAVPQLAVMKSASLASINAAGQTITYTIAVSNPGNVTITALTVADPLGTVICAVSGNATIASLAPAGSLNCTITYGVPQTVIDNNGGGDGKIDNTATASGSYGATALNANGSAAVNIIRNPLLVILKTANTSARQPAGAVITYTYKVTNSGNVTMTAVAVTDVHNGTGTLVGPTNETLTTDTAPLGDSIDAAINGNWDTLAPGDAVTFTATYTVTQNDVDTLQ